MEIDPFTALVLFAAGILGGALNAVAGGASFVTFPVLIWAGLSPLSANVTNMVALVTANIAALPAYKKQLKEMGSAVWPPLWLGILGGIIGAVLLLWLGDDVFSSAVPWLLLTATLLFAFAKQLRQSLARFASTDKSKLGVLGIGLILLFSIYGGYFGAGVGQILLAAMIVIGHDDFHDANALKNLTASAITIVAVVIFGFSGEVSWVHAGIMLVGGTTGGFLGGKGSQMVPQKMLKIGVICFGVFLTILFFVRGA